MNLFGFKSPERDLSAKLGLSRATLRKVAARDEQLNVSSIRKVAQFFNRSISIVFYPKNHLPKHSVVYVALSIERDGFDSWKIHLMNLVDEFRLHQDERLLLLPPPETSNEKVRALLAATVVALCEEARCTIPEWTSHVKPLTSPWFVSGIESLKAIALVESPYSFRSKNIFVLSNFLQRA